MHSIKHGGNVISYYWIVRSFVLFHLRPSVSLSLFLFCNKKCNKYSISIKITVANESRSSLIVIKNKEFIRQMSSTLVYVDECQQCMFFFHVYTCYIHIFIYSHAECIAYANCKLVTMHKTYGKWMDNKRVNIRVMNADVEQYIHNIHRYSLSYYAKTCFIKAVPHKRIEWNWVSVSACMSMCVLYALEISTITKVTGIRSCE